jgi:hypothetical protein
MSCEVRDCFENVCVDLLDSIYHDGSTLLCLKHWEEISQDPEKLEELGLNLVYGRIVIIFSAGLFIIACLTIWQTAWR